jgi:hypothetical protein
MRSTLSLVAGITLALAASAASAVDWAAVAGEQTVVVVTADEDGAPRETTIWLAVVDGQGYVRTGGTTWGDNVERNPDVTLRIGARDYAVRAVRVRDEALLAHVAGAMREKYGTSDALSSWVRFGETRIFRMVERAAQTDQAPAGP